MAENHRAPGVLPEEDTLYSNRLRLVPYHEVGDALENLAKSLCQRGSGRGADYAAFDQPHRAITGTLHEPVAGDCGAWVDAEYKHGFCFPSKGELPFQTGLVDVGVCIDLLDVVRIFQHLDQLHQLFRILPFDSDEVLRDHGELGIFPLHLPGT